LFSNVNHVIKKGAKIVDYHGAFVTDAEYLDIQEYHAIMLNTGINFTNMLRKGSGSLTLLGFPSLPGALINHRPDGAFANCEFFMDRSKWKKDVFENGFVVVRATRDIIPFEEFYADYGEGADALLSI
jgi:hypothetical protein